MDEAASQSQRPSQIAAIQFYLQELIQYCQSHWMDNTTGVSNYLTLWDQIRGFASPTDPVRIVNFNYDQLAEEGLRGIGVTFPDIAAYITNPVYRLFKVHSSVNWAEEVEHPTATPNGNDSNEHAQVVARLAAELVGSSGAHGRQGRVCLTERA